jgi:hypothetical protein
MCRTVGQGVNGVQSVNGVNVFQGCSSRNTLKRPDAGAILCRSDRYTG